MIQFPSLPEEGGIARRFIAVAVTHNGQTDGCDCPACVPYCERIGRKCFLECEGCRGKPERDEFGPLKSRTLRVVTPCAT
jgi:hypothetical protein